MIWLVGSMALVSLLLALWSVWAVRELMGAIKAQQSQFSAHWDRMNTLAEQVQNGQRYTIAHIQSPCLECSGTGMKFSNNCFRCRKCDGTGKASAVTAKSDNGE